MAAVTIRQGGKTAVLPIEGAVPLKDLLSQAGFHADHPCGGRGVCGKCTVTLSGAVSEPNEAEQKAGVRLSCQAVILGDAEVILPDSQDNEIELSGSSVMATDGETGLGAAIDIGTTTLALKLYDLRSGQVLATVGVVNPQRAIAADVMGRIGAALNGQAEQLRRLIEDALSSLLESGCKQAGVELSQVKKLVVTGNTTMLYLLTQRNPDCLSHAPFHADCLFDEDSILFGIPVYYPPCMNAFVGADITCAVLASGMCEKTETALLCDIGTNGEMALWKDGTLYVTSTAAGPAFEGAGISCGCGSIRGAIDAVTAEDGELHIHTIGGADAVGLCGSGLIDAVAAMLELEIMDETGAMDDDEILLADNVTLLQKDIRSVQLAKAAIAAGIETLMEDAGIDCEDISAFYIAGGFGSHLNAKSAAAIGLFPGELSDKIVVLGNAALTGSAMLMLNRQELINCRRIANASTHVNLGGNPKFNEHYIDAMMFEEIEE